MTASASARSVPGSEVGDDPHHSITEQNPDNCFRILLATDNHIGYAEKDPIRGQDAINTFREILEIGRDAEVDFILLAGDLFHENRPSRTCMHQTIALLREYTLGDKPVSFELLSDPYDGSAPGFSFPAVNYEDPNLNIATPVFSIHGNHDDPQGTGPEGALCALDVLSVSGVLNYFGKVDLQADEAAPDDGSDKGIRIKPILLRKGSSHLAMYGVGNVKDARMHYELRSNRVKMYMPEGGDVPEEDWFNILLVHQNRVKHGPQQSVPEGMFDDSIRLVVWGHEHDCRITPEKVEGKDYWISQPGSSVATSLAPGEAIPKHVGIMSIQGSQFQIAEIPLKTVRPFELDEVILSYAAEQGVLSLDDKDSITDYLRKEVERLVKQAEVNWRERNPDPKEKMMLPLIRVKVETTDAKEMTNPVRFGQLFVGKVANPRDILQYYRKKKPTERKVKNNPDLPDEDEEEWEGEDASILTTNDRLAKLRMANLVKQYLQAQNLEVLVENGMEDAVMRFVEKDDKDAIKDFVSDTLKMVGRDMRSKDMDEDDVEDHMLQAKEHAASQYAEARPIPKEKPKKGKKKQNDSDEDSMLEEDDDQMDLDSDGSLAESKAPRKGKGKAPPARGKGKKPLFDDASDSDSEEDEEEEEVLPAPKKRSAASTATSTRKPAAKTTARAPAKKAPTRGGASAKAPQQSQLTFSKGNKASKPIELSDDE
ncbi:DNA repair protein (mre11) [Kwoniella shivajii]|uniref:Double-strand break repair protein n=1 Tax=Kwoniella shivajii TaxID=564305 RepID=A0ABZ1D5U7_9TREE|nr:DNA repair protein (mre11) [Kwoniella shivajii]